MAEGRALYRKWRPQFFADLVGQEHIKQTIINAINTERVAHAYLFAGPRGTGKTSLARLIAKAINCTDNKAGEPCGKCANCTALVSGNFIDLIEIDAASHTSVDDVRDLIERVNLVPSLGRYKVYIIDEVHMLSKNAFNALLKTLEEPPAHVVFILATTEVHKLLPTVISRCQYFDFHYLSQSEVTAQLAKITAQEGIKIATDALALIAESSEGSLRDALSMLDQAAGMGEKEITREAMAKLLGVVDSSVINQLTGFVIAGNVRAAIDLVNDAYLRGFDLSQLAKQWMTHLRELLMTKLGNQELLDRSSDQKQSLASQAEGVTAGQLVNWLQRLVEATNSYKLPHLPQLALEMAILRCANPTPNTTVSVASATPTKVVVPAVPMVAAVTTTKVATGDATNADLAQIWPKLCEQLDRTNPATGALLKMSEAKWENDKLVVELPNDFLKTVMSKASNHQLVLGGLAELNVVGVSVEYKVIKKTDAAVAAVADVFGIM